MTETIALYGVWETITVANRNSHPSQATCSAIRRVLQIEREAQGSWKYHIHSYGGIKGCKSMVILCPNPSLPKSFKYIVRRCFGPPKGFLRRSFGVQTPILKSGFQVPRPEGETRGSPEEMAGQGWYCFSNSLYFFRRNAAVSGCIFHYFLIASMSGIFSYLNGWFLW